MVHYEHDKFTSVSVLQAIPPPSSCAKIKTGDLVSFPTRQPTSFMLAPYCCKVMPMEFIIYISQRNALVSNPRTKNVGLYRVPIPLSISDLHVEDADQIRESKEWMEKGQGYVNSFRPICYCSSPDSISIAFSFIVRRRQKMS